LRVLGLEDGNGLSAVNIPGGVEKRSGGWEPEAERAGRKVQNFVERIGQER